MRTMLAQNDSMPVIDVREDREVRKGIIPGAIHIGRGVLERDIESMIPDKNAEMVLYCGGGYRSVLAAENLQKMGYAKVWSLEGGIKAW
ncbi:MAG: sulfurtransferase, partial [Nitrospira sp.]|nr:sulfurtransferase [Nitrospira sp.]